MFRPCMLAIIRLITNLIVTIQYICVRTVTIQYICVRTLGDEILSYSGGWHGLSDCCGLV
jgi:hypothetical protein